jgi:uncharacterized protein YaiE (UPF0345 family)
MNKFIEKSKNKFKDTYSYDNLNYITTKKPIQLTCIKHNITFQITTRSHLDSEVGGCYECDKDNRFTIFMNKSKEKYNNNFIIDKLSFINNLTKINIKCIKHNNNFEVFPQNHLLNDNGGCNQCIIKTKDYFMKELIKNSNQKFNNNFDFSNFVYENALKKSTIICKKHNYTFNTSASEHIKMMYGGCKQCNPLYSNKKIKNEVIKNEIKLNIKLEKNEKFKLLNLPNYDNLYKISNYGKVYSLRNNDYMKITENKNGYNIVRLTDLNSKSKIYRVHRLVALLFVKNKNNKDVVDHINNKRNDNYYKNLRWVTTKENMQNISKNTIYTQKNNDIVDMNNNTNKDLLNNKNYKNIGIINNMDFSNYQINEYGNVIKNGINLKYSTLDGYFCVNICDKNEKKYKSMRIHRLVAYVFLNKPEKFTDDFVVNHIDNNRLNNYYKNLEWCTSKENTTKYFTKRIQQVDINTNKVIKEYKTFTEIYEELGKTYNSHISKCCKGIYKTAHGYKWQIIN